MESNLRQTTSSDVGEIDKDGIKTIRWTSDHQVGSLETQDGQTLYPTSAPGARSYILIAILPILGFFIPWARFAQSHGWEPVSLQVQIAESARQRLKPGVSAGDRLSASLRHGKKAR